MMASVRAITMTLTLAAAGLAVAAAPAHADPLTCQGRAVSVEGDTGTEGDDVMVVGPGQKSVSTGAGNDLVCIRLGDDVRRYFFLDTGPGDDVVHNETTSSKRSVTVYLGAGADTYVGSDATADFVTTGTGAVTRTDDTERDAVDTRGGNDFVLTGSAAPGVTNPDVVTTGDGDDALDWAGEQTGTPVDLGPGYNRITLNSGWLGDVDVDAPAGIVSAGSRPVLRWAGGVTDWRLAYANSRTTFTGADLDEYVTYDPSQAVGGDPNVSDPQRRLDASMGDGDDRLELLAAAGGSWTGGPGEDRLGGPRCAGVDVRLGHRFVCRGGDFDGTRFSASIDAWERVDAAGDQVHVVGTNKGETIGIFARRGSVEARAGRDVVTTGSSATRHKNRRPIVLRGGRGADRLTGDYGNERLLGGPGNDVLRGKRGHDQMWGGEGDDRLLGGPGRDHAWGGPGRDRCVAEVRRSCERR